MSKLVEKAANGEPFIIAKSGKPMVKVTSLEAPAGKRMKRIGFMKFAAPIPDDFNEMGREEIEKLFGGDE